MPQVAEETTGIKRNHAMGIVAMQNLEHTENTDRVNDNVCKPGESVLRETDHGRAGLVDKQVKETERLKAGGSSGISHEFGKIEIYDSGRGDSNYTERNFTGSKHSDGGTKPIPERDNNLPNEMRPIAPPVEQRLDTDADRARHAQEKVDATQQKYNWQKENFTDPMFHEVPSNPGQTRTEQQVPRGPQLEPDTDGNSMRRIPPPEPPVRQVLIPVEEQHRRKEQATIDKGKWMEENNPSMTKLGPPGELSSEERAAIEKQKKEAKPKVENYNALSKDA
jgi:hypothetical protein